MKSLVQSRILSFILLLTVCFKIDLLFAQSDSDQEVDLSRGHLPMIYVSTSETQAHFNLLVPHLKSYEFRAIRRDRRNKKTHIAKIIGKPIKDPDQLLLDHVLKVKFEGLDRATEYDLQVFEVSRHGTKLVDERVFSTFDQSKRNLKFATGSCMCDEMIYEEPRQKITQNLIRTNPDVIVFSGDLVYVDSFSYVERDYKETGKTTDLQIWQRYHRSFDVNPLFRSHRLIPVVSTWDDHDTGIDNGHKKTPSLREARRAFQALFGSPEIKGVIENGKTGTQKVVSVRGQHFVLLDNRSFRSPPSKTSRYGHLGKQQEAWLKKVLQEKEGFFWLVLGDMWGSHTITRTNEDGSTKRITEGFHGDHPKQYEAVMEIIRQSKVSFGLISGDIHFSQIVDLGPKEKGPRFNPFNTLEIVSSPMYSFIFNARPGEYEFWSDRQRAAAYKGHNFVLVDSKRIPSGLDFDASVIDENNTTQFSIGSRISNSKSRYQTKQAQFLVPSSQLPQEDGTVKAIFLDADSNIRVSPSGSVSANHEKDVYILPGVSDQIAKWNRMGYVVYIVSNQGGISSEKVRFSGDGTYEGKRRIADKALQYTIELIRQENSEAIVHGYDFSERKHGDYYRKPQKGMYQRFVHILRQEGLKLNRMESKMVGDSQFSKGAVAPSGFVSDSFSSADRKFAHEIDFQYVHPEDAFGWTRELRRAIMDNSLKGQSKFKAILKAVKEFKRKSDSHCDDSFKS